MLLQHLLAASLLAKFINKLFNKFFRYSFNNSSKQPQWLRTTSPRENQSLKFLRSNFFWATDPGGLLSTQCLHSLVHSVIELLVNGGVKDFTAAACASRWGFAPNCLLLVTQGTFNVLADVKLCVDIVQSILI